MQITIKDIFYDSLLNYLKEHNICMYIGDGLPLTKLKKSFNLEFHLFYNNDYIPNNLKKIEPSIQLLEKNFIYNIHNFNKINIYQYILNDIFINHQQKFISEFKDIPYFEYDEHNILNDAFLHFRHLLYKDNFYKFIIGIKPKVNKSSLRIFFSDLCIYTSIFSKLDLKNIYLNFVIHYNDLIKKDLFSFSKIILEHIDKEFHSEFMPYLSTDKSMNIYLPIEIQPKLIHIDIKNLKNVYPLFEAYTPTIHNRILNILITTFNSKEFKSIYDFKKIECNLISKSSVFQIQIFDTDIHPKFIESLEFGIQQSIDYLLSNNCENNKKYFLLSSKEFKKYLLQSFEYFKLNIDCKSNIKKTIIQKI